MNNETSYQKRVLSGAASTGAAQVMRIVLTFASTMVVARLLSPTDYGIYAMAAPVVAFAMLFQNFGFDHAVVQSDQIDDVQLSSLLWLNVGLCAALAMLLLLAAPLVTIFYGNAAAGRIVAASSLMVLLTAPNPLYNAMMNRAMRFHAQSLVDVGSSVAGFAGTVIAALTLRSYWALWIGGMLATAANTLLFLLLDRWRPRATFRWDSIRSLVGFGGGVSVANISTFFTRNVDNVLLARFSGAAALGLYDRAYKLMLFPLQNFSAPMARTILPVLARTRDDPARFRRAHLLFVRALVLLAVPGILVAAIAADDVVNILLGPRWQHADQIFRWLAAAAVLLLVNDTTIWLFIATGRTRALLRLSLFASATVVIGFVVGLPWGPVGMAIAYAVGEALRAPLIFTVATRGTPVRAADLFALHLVTLASAAAAIGVDLLLPASLPGLVRLASLLMVAYAVAFAVQFASREGRELIAIGWRWAQLASPRSRRSAAAGEAS